MAWKNKLPLLLVIVAMALVYYFDLTHYLSFESLKQHRQLLLQWTKAHFIAVSLGYCLIYILAVTLSIPGAVFITLTGGFLFGIVWGALFVITSATIGAIFIFLIVKYAFADKFAQKSETWLGKMRRGFNDSAFNYLLVLRLVPLFPFWMVNIAPALLNVSLPVYASATFFGIMPASIVFVALGTSLGQVFATDSQPDLSILLQPQILLSLCGLALLALIPVIYKHFQVKSK